MRRRCFLIALAASLLASLEPARAAEPFVGVPEGIEIRSFHGNPGALQLISEDTGISAFVTPSFGGRVMFYGIEAQNLLWFPRQRGNTSALEAGGYQLDIGPESRGIPPRPILWAGQYRSEFLRKFTVSVKSLPDPLLGVQLIKEIVIDPESGDLGVTQIITNVSTREVSFCHWDRTLVQPDGYVIVPLNKKSRFKKKWAIRRGDVGNYVYDGDSPESDRVQIKGGILYAKASGKPTKIGVDSDAGWVAYAWRHYLFVKYFPYYKTGDYTDGGCTVEIFWNERFAELEPLSPEVKLKPGDGYRFPEMWKIIELKDEVTSLKDARKATKKVPRSPFDR
jgi:hypothetical protein